MPYNYKEMKWQPGEVAYPECLWEVLDAVGRETDHTPDEVVVLLVSYAMNDLCRRRRADDIMERTMHLHLFVQQWLRHESPQAWAEATGEPAGVFRPRPLDGNADTRKEWWDE